MGAAALEVLDEFVAADPKAVTFDLRPVLDLCLQVGAGPGRGGGANWEAMPLRCPYMVQGWGCGSKRGHGKPHPFAHIWSRGGDMAMGTIM